MPERASLICSIWLIVPRVQLKAFLGNPAADDRAGDDFTAPFQTFRPLTKVAKKTEAHPQVALDLGALVHRIRGVDHLHGRQPELEVERLAGEPGLLGAQLDRLEVADQGAQRPSQAAVQPPRSWCPRARSVRPRMAPVISVRKFPHFRHADRRGWSAGRGLSAARNCRGPDRAWRGCRRRISLAFPR